MEEIVGQYKIVEQQGRLVVFNANMADLAEFHSWEDARAYCKEQQEIDDTPIAFG